jgi:VCBS repeat-containing protein
MRHDDTSLGGTQHHNTHHELELAAAATTTRHAHVPTAQGLTPTAVPILIQANAQHIVPGPDGIVTLPAGVELADVHAVGRDLVVNLPDGTQMVIVDGAVFVPELVIGSVEVPATNLAALLIDAEPKPAAGDPQSSGGNFAVPVGPLDPGAPLGDLLPPTELSYTPPTYRELAVAVVNHTPSVIIDTPDNPAGAINATATVNESGLPSGSDAASTSETTTGSIIVTSLDNPTTITINGVAVTGVAGQVITGVYGTLTIVSVTADAVNYSYTLSGPSAGDTNKDIFTVGVTDRDGDAASSTLTVSIVDDIPTARNDTDALAAGSHGPESGNVITGAGTTSGTAGADTKGADGASISAISAGSASDTSFDESGNLVLHGAYGTLTMKADGSYSYVRDAGSPGGVTDTFGYTLRDGDGDASTATLSISIPDATPTVLITPDGEGGSNTVYESGLPARGGEPAGSNAAADSETTTGSITVGQGDGPAVVAIGGVAITTVGQTFANATGTLTITSITATSIGYSYTLADNTLTDPSSVTFAVTVTDKDGDVASANLAISIVDDVPTARADTDALAAGAYGPEAGNVITGSGTTSGAPGADTQGADGASVTAISAGASSDSSFDESGNLVLHGTYGTLTMKADGSYSYVRDAGTPGGVTDTFGYTLTDGDGDSSPSTLTISIGNTTPTVHIPAAGDGGTSVSEAGLGAHLAFGGSTTLPAGSGEIADGIPGNNSDTSETSTTGTISFTPGDGPAVVTIGGVTVTGANQTFAGTFGTLTIDSYSASGTITYHYTLNVSTSGNTTADHFAVIVTDQDGQATAPADLTIAIVDDMPTARADTDALAAGAYGPEAGNVITGSGTTSGAPGADTQGADGASVTAISAGASSDSSFDESGNLVLHGTYGTLTMKADGSYSYVRDAGTPGGVTDTFGYTLTDGDGDSSPSTLTISIGNTTPTVHIPAAGDGGTSVSEAGLGAHLAFGGSTTLPAGSGEIADGIPGNNSDTSETSTTGTISFTPGDGPAVVTIGGVTVTGANQTFAGTFGTLTIDSYSASGTITYHYTLNVSTSGNTTADHFAVIVTDQDGQATAPADLTIAIVDDVPTARADTDTVAAGSFAPEGGNVITGAGTDGGTLGSGVDTLGADGGLVLGALPQGGVFTLIAPGGSTTIHGLYGALTIGSDGTYTYVRDAGSAGGVDDKFFYVLRDGDGDTSPTSLTIHIGDSHPVLTVPAAGGATTTVYESGLAARGGEPAGSGTAPNTTVVSGTIDVTSPDGLENVFVNGVQLTGSTIFPVTVSSNSTGTLVITGGTYDDATGIGHLNYTYTLLDNTLTDPSSVTFPISVTDADGDPATSNLVINIVDDAPTAHADTGTVVEGALLSVAASGVLGNDTPGADGLAGGGVVGVATGSNTAVALSTGTATAIAGTYGTLTLYADGHYTYQANANAVNADQIDHFVYTIKDGDGDTSTTTLDITVTNVTLNAQNVTGSVFEAALDTVKNAGEFAASSVTGSNPGSTGELVTGTISNVFAAANGYTPQTTTTPYGTFTLDAAGHYSYTLTSPIIGAQADNSTNNEVPVQHFTYTVVDTNGNSTTGSVDITIVDDVPIASPDTGSTLEGGTLTVSAVAGVISNDTPGADGLVGGGGVVGVATGTNTAVALSTGVNTVITGTYGTLTLQANGSYVYHANTNQVVPAGATDNFVYTIKDGDGDTSTTTLKISVADVNLTTGGATGTVDEAALAVIGSNPSLTTETTGGTLAGSSGAGGLSYALVGSGTGAHGTISISSAGVWSYTLTSPFTNSPAANDGTAIDGTETFTYKVTDANGNFTTNTIVISAKDDVPSASPDTGSTLEGGTLTVSAVAGVISNDTPGADGLVGGGGVVGVATGTNTAVALSTGVNTVITGTYGTLTLQANGSYVYHANTNQVVPAGATDNFVYTIKDGDGDTSTTTLKISVADVNLTTGGATGTVDEAALAVIGSNPSLTTETTGGTLAGSSGAGGLSYALVGSGTGAHGTISISSAGVWSYTLTSPFTNSPAANDGTAIDGTETFTYKVTDANGNFTTNTIVISVKDDVPTLLSPVQSQQVDNNPADAVAVGGLHLLPGADGFGSVVITPTLTGLTSGGHALVTHQVGNVLTAYADLSGNGFSADDTAVFTITVAPPASGTTGGTYTFDLIAPLDGAIVNTAIGGATSFGSGPNPGGQVLDSSSALHLSVVSGYNTSSFNTAAWLGGAAATGLTVGGVNGSTGGWGIDSNNFGTGQFFVFDFSAGTLRNPDGAGGFTPPTGINLPNASLAHFTFVGASGGDVIDYVVHYTNGTFSSGQLTGATQFTATAPIGTTIDDVEFFGVNIGGGYKVQLTDVSSQSSVVNYNIPVALTISDGDGDQVAGSFNVVVKDGAAPFATVAPVVLDLNHDGHVTFLSAAAGVTFDYNGDGVKEATPWAGPNDGILVRDSNHDGLVTSASEFVFGHDGMTDLQALAAQYGPTLDANDADFASFAVWQDANSNGVVDAGEMKSLAAAGIASISLSSDGVSYTTADGQVEVAGTGSYTTTGGVTASLADASFVTGTAVSVAATTTDQLKLAANSNVTLVAALAAAGLASEAAAAHSAPVASDTAIAAVNQVIDKVAVDATTTSDGGHQSISGETHEAIVTTQPATSTPHVAVEAANDTHPIDASTQAAHAETALLGGTDAPAHAAAMTSIAPIMVAMPSAQAMAAAGLTGTGVQHGGEVAREIVSGLTDGHGQAQLDALINALPGHANGEGPGTAIAASLVAQGVSSWDTAHVAAFQMIAAHANTIEAVMLHHDAVQPVAHAG